MRPGSPPEGAHPDVPVVRGDPSAVDRLLARAAHRWLDVARLPSAPTTHVAIVTCMDARLDVRAQLALSPGEAHVLRNAGGIVTDDILRSLVISQRSLGTREVMVIHHSDCGLLGLDDAAFGEDLARACGGRRPTWSAGGLEDLDEAVRRSVDRVRTCPWLVHTAAVRGFVDELETGRLREVTCP